MLDMLPSSAPGNSPYASSAYSEYLSDLPMTDFFAQHFSYSHNFFIIKDRRGVFLPGLSAGRVFLIIRLLLVGGPSYVVRLIVAAIVGKAIKRPIPKRFFWWHGRARANVSKKLHEIIYPLRANLDPLLDVIGIFGTSGLHVIPRVIFEGVAQTVSPNGIIVIPKEKLGLTSNPSALFIVALSKFCFPSATALAKTEGDIIYV